VENPERKCRIKSTQYFTLEENKKKKKKDQGGSKTQIRHKPHGHQNADMEGGGLEQECKRCQLDE
jgi:hypothetical protein